MKGSRLMLAWVAILAATVGLLSVAAFDDGGAETDTERIQRLSDSFACPECRGQSVSESNAAAAIAIRQFISDQVTAGATDDEIRDRLVASWQADVLLNPPAEGFAALVWILPVMLVIIGAVGVGAAVTRNRGADRQASDDDRSLVAQARARNGRP
jgi:cytochrome c-type biogenesis protein CcmH